MTTDTREGAPPPPPPPHHGPRTARLTRRSDEDDRWLGGVCGGLADHLGLDVTVVRAVFAVVALFGGGGVALYLVLWVVLPERETGEVIAHRLLDHGRRIGGDRGVAFWVGSGLIVIAGIALLDGIVNGGVLWALALIVVGVLLFQSDDITTHPRDRQAVFPGPRAAWARGGTAGVTGTPTDAEPFATQDLEADADLVGSAPADAPISDALPPVPPAPFAATATPRPPRRQRRRSILGRLTLGLAVLWAGGALFWNEATTGPDVTAAGIVGIAMAVIGAGLLVGARFGRARWLAVVGALLVPLLIGASVVDRASVPWGSGVGERVVSPNLGQEAVVDQLFAGELRVDLTDQWFQMEANAQNGVLDGAGEPTTRVSLQVGAGEIRVLVPAHWGLVVDARVGAGSITVNGLDGTSVEGLDRTLQQTFVGEDGAPVVRLDLSADLGEIRIDRQEVR